MSAKKSWDVVRSQPTAAPAPAPAAVRRPLREQRRQQRRVLRILLGIGFFLFLVALLYIIWLPGLRVHTIEAQGLEADGVRATVARVLEGTYGYIIPRNSLFFLPEKQIRAQILKEFPDVSAVSLKPHSLTSLVVTTTPRASAFIWCGTSVDVVVDPCFNADAQGLIFSTFTASATDASSTLHFFAPLTADLASGSSPIGMYVGAAAQIPDVLRFVKGLRTLNVPVSAIALSNDEADLYLQGPTKIRYVLGHEEQAMALASSVIPTLSLTDGTIDYVDLRFTATSTEPTRVYVKRFGQ